MDRHDEDITFYGLRIIIGLGVRILAVYSIVMEMSAVQNSARQVGRILNRAVSYELYVPWITNNDCRSRFDKNLPRLEFLLQNKLRDTANKATAKFGNLEILPKGNDSVGIPSRLTGLTF